MRKKKRRKRKHASEEGGSISSEEGGSISTEGGRRSLLSEEEGSISTEGGRRSLLSEEVGRRSLLSEEVGRQGANGAHSFQTTPTFNVVQPAQPTKKRTKLKVTYRARGNGDEKKKNVVARSLQFNGANELTTIEEGNESNDDNDDYNNNNNNQYQEDGFRTPQKRKRTDFGDRNSNTEAPKKQRQMKQCIGLTIDYVISRKKQTNQKLQDEDEWENMITDGYNHLIGQCLIHHGYAISHQHRPHKYISEAGYAGLVKSQITSKEVSWICKQNLLVPIEIQSFEDNSNNHNNMEKPYSYATHYSFFSKNCEKDCDTVRGVCRTCASTKYNFLRRLENETSLRRGTLSNKVPNSRIVMSPMLTMERLAMSRKRINALALRYKRKLAEEIAMKLLSNHQIQMVAKDRDREKKIFGGDIEKLASDFFDSKGVSQDHLMRYIWAEVCKQTRVRWKSGKSACQYSPVLLRFAITLREQTKDKCYIFLSKAFNLPSISTIRQYTSIGAHDPDGIQVSAIKLKRDELQEEIKSKKSFPNSDERQKELLEDENHLTFIRMGSLSHDSKKIQGKCVMDPHTSEVVGFTQDAFEMNIIMEEMKRMCEKAEREVELPEDPSDAAASSNRANSETVKKDNAPDLVEHYLVFMFTSWHSSKMHKVQFVCARYGLHTITADFLKREILDIITSLYMFGFIVVCIAGDGAAENRSAFKRLGTQTAKEVLPKFTLQEFVTVKETLKLQSIELPSESDFENINKMIDELSESWGLPIAFPHPINPNITVFIMSDTPHLIKKIVNCLEMSGSSMSKRRLTYDGVHISLKRLYELWEKQKTATGDHIRTTKLGVDHYKKTATNRMKSHLSFQVTSQSQINLVKKWKDDDSDLAVIPLLQNCDMLIDIMNNNEKKKFHMINHPRHPHLAQLLKIMNFFFEWRKQTIGEEQFITSQSYEDLQFIIFGFVSFCTKYVREDQSRVVHNRRHGTDCIENHFGNCNNSCPNGSLTDFRSASAKATGINANTFIGRAKNNTSGDSYIGPELWSKVQKAPRVRTKKTRYSRFQQIN